MNKRRIALSVDHQLCSGDNQLNSPVILMTGTARAGKTTLGRIMGSCKNVEFFDEPWMLMTLIISAGLSLIDRNLAIGMFKTYFYELINDRILMRAVSFRPTDLSYIGHQKAPEEIKNRMLKLHSRNDVRKYILEKKTVIVLNLTDTTPYLSLLKEIFPDSPIIHVFSPGYCVAKETTLKGWYTDSELKRPTHGQLYRPVSISKSNRNNKRYFHFWVRPGDEQEFLKRSEFARGLYYWRRIIEMSKLPKVSVKNDSKLISFNFYDALNDPKRIRSLLKKMNFKPT
ncbi:MAG TPA: hypothetical protein PLH57_09705, partial [Oligoflexia bacterium]|nr:hypothetical protein [Oligoflexia bacterium]